LNPSKSLHVDLGSLQSLDFQFCLSHYTPGCSEGPGKSGIDMDENS